MPSSRTADEFSLFYFPPLISVNWADGGREVCARNELVNGSWAQARQGSTHYGKPGLVFARRSSPSIAFRAHPAGAGFASNTGVVLPVEGVDPLLLMAYLNSSPVRAAVNALSNRDSYTVGHIKRIIWPEFTAEQRDSLASAGGEILAVRHRLYRIEETDPWFERSDVLCAHSRSTAAYEAWLRWLSGARADLIRLAGDIDATVGEIFHLDDPAGLEAEFQVSPADVIRPARLFETSREAWARRCASLAFGLAIGRGRLGVVPSNGTTGALRALGHLPSWITDQAAVTEVSYLVDDPGHGRDVVPALEAAWDELWPDDSQDEAGHPLLAVGDPRAWIATQMFEQHRQVYRAGKRSAPVYWQLGLQSRRYSVWVYGPSMGRDGPLTLLNDVVLPKLELEERRLAADSAPPDRNRVRMGLHSRSDQRQLVEDLRLFRDELKRVAPLWAPDFDDGIVVAMAPLWRAVIDRAWQRQLMTTWDGLAAGEYDWAHLAMHLWPERVVPKCASDRSLAIAHGLEDVFWAEGADGKWVKRPRPTRPVEDLIAERNSPAVKAALADLLGAPALAGAGRGRGRS